MPITPEQQFARSKHRFVDHHINALLWFSVVGMCIAAPDGARKGWHCERCIIIISVLGDRVLRILGQVIVPVQASTKLAE